MTKCVCVNAEKGLPCEMERRVEIELRCGEAILGGGTVTGVTEEQLERVFAILFPKTNPPEPPPATPDTF